LGFVSVNLDWQADPRGAPIYEALNPLEMAWPEEAWNGNLRSVRRMWRITWHDADFLKEKFGKISPEKYGFPCGEEWGSSPQKKDKKKGSSVSSQELFCLAELRIMERSGSIWIDDDGAPHDSEPADIEALEIPQYRPRRYWLGADGIILGKEIILAENNSLGWHAVSCNSVTGESSFFGILDSMKDAQQLLNRMISQSLYTFDRQSKGGIIAERGAFENSQEAEANYARSDKIVWVNNGAISGNRIMPRPVDRMNESLISLQQTAERAFSALSGVSEEFMGTREVNQPGVLERERKQSTMNVLAAPFAALKNMRLAAAEDIIYIGRHWISDKMLIKIDRQYKRVSRADLSREYDLYLDDAPSGQNEKEEVFERILKLAPMISQLRDSGVSDSVIAQILKYSPLPSGFVEGLEKELSGDEGAAQAEQQQQEQQQKQAQAAEANMELELGLKKADLDSRHLDNAAKERELANG